MLEKKYVILVVVMDNFLKKTKNLTRYSCGIEIQDDYVSELKKDIEIYKDLSEIKKKNRLFFFISFI